MNVRTTRFAAWLIMASLCVCASSAASAPQRRVRELIEVVESGPASQALTAIRQLAKFKSRAKKAADPIARHLTSSNAELRAAAANALKAIGKASVSPTVDVIQNQLEGESLDHLIFTIELLEELDSKQGREMWFSAAKRADVTESGARAVSTLGLVGVECLLRAAEREDNVPAAFHGIRTAAELSTWTFDVVAPLAEGLADEEIRSALVTAATSDVRADDLERYERWCTGEPSSLQTAGIWALGTLATVSPVVPPDAFLELLGSGDKAIRRGAVWGLTRVAGIAWQPSLEELVEAEAFVPPEYPDGPMVRLGVPMVDLVRLMISHQVRRPYLVDDAAVAALSLSQASIAEGNALDGEFAEESGVRDIWELGSRWHLSIPSLPSRIVIEAIEPTADQEALAQQALPWVTAKDGVVASGMLRLMASLGSRKPEVLGAITEATNDEDPLRRRIGYAALSAFEVTSRLSSDEHRAALKTTRSPELPEVFIFAGERAFLEALIAEASDPRIPVYPWTWIDVIELEGPTERLQALFEARLQAGDLSMAALVTDYCSDPKPALHSLLESQSALERMIGVACFKRIGAQENASQLRATETASTLQRRFVREAIRALH